MLGACCRIAMRVRPGAVPLTRLFSKYRQLFPVRAAKARSASTFDNVSAILLRGM